MGWPWSSNASDASNDPISKLDPALKEFLEKESPLKYDDSRPTPSALPPAQSSTRSRGADTYRSRLGLHLPGVDQKTQDSTPSEDGRKVPAESLFQDGRYADLWKGYRPQSEVESTGLSDQDRLAAVVDAYNDRKAEIGRAALENCVDFQIAEKDCFSNGGWAKRMTMCRAENRAFNRCYTMQSRFLKALGYLSMERTPEEEERIQMHADKLYHEMLERERVVQEAKERGLEAPELPALIQADSTTRALGEDSAWARARQQALDKGITANLSSYSPERQEEIKERIKGLSKEEKELELQLLAAESRAQLEYADRITQHIEQEKMHRADRRERGKETIGDTIKRLWGWD